MEKTNINQKQVNETIQVFLDGMGFDESQGKPGLYTKQHENGISVMFWDFRKKPSRFYVSDIGTDGYWDISEAHALPEYIEVHKKLEDGEKELPAEQPKQKRSARRRLKKADLPVLETKSEAFDFINLRDDNQVLMEMQGGILEEFVYTIKTKEGKVTQLSYAGVKEAMRLMGGIHVESCNYQSVDDDWIVLCRAVDLQRNNGMFGIAQQPKRMMTKAGIEVNDLHSLSKAMSRAQRNAIRVLIPEKLVREVFKTYLQKFKDRIYSEQS